LVEFLTTAGEGYCQEREHGLRVHQGAYLLLSAVLCCLTSRGAGQLHDQVNSSRCAAHPKRDELFSGFGLVHGLLLLGVSGAATRRECDRDNDASRLWNRGRGRQLLRCMGG